MLQSLEQHPRDHEDRVGTRPWAQPPSDNWTTPTTGKRILGEPHPRTE
jgi:hypothetical protein